MCISESISIFMFTMEMNASIILRCFLNQLSVSTSKFKGIILNEHCVEVSLVNNDASTLLVYTLCCCSVSASESSCCDI